MMPKSVYQSGVQMKRTLATLVTLMLVTTLFVGFAAGPAAAQCTSTSVSTNAGTSAAIVNTQTSVQVNVGNNIQTGVAVSINGDAAVAQTSSISQGNVIDGDQC